MKKEKISIIIPVYNEKRTLGSIIEVARTWPSGYEVVVVDDGSTDDTHKVAALFGRTIRLVSHKTNKGKGHALAAGIQKSRGEILIFLDGDMVGLTHYDLDRLSQAVRKKSADMTLGRVRFWRWHGYGPHASITGVRAVRKAHVLPHLTTMRSTGYGVEFLLNHVHKNKRVMEIPMPHVSIMSKVEKLPLHIAFVGYISEFWHIGREYIRQRFIPSFA
jgi:glycosyltransferase involved in cell wall biosynthesis